MKGYVAGIILCCFCVFGIGAPAAAETVDGVAAVVNGDIVTYFELNELLNVYIAGLPKTISDEERANAIREAREGLLNKLIDESLLTQEAVRLGIVVRDEEVQANIQELIKKNKLTLDQFKEILQKEGGSYERYKKDLKDHLMKMRVASREISSKISISDDEVGEYYAKHREVYEGKEAVLIRQILFPLPAGVKPEMRQKIQELAEAEAAKLKSGAPFEEVLQDAVAQGAEAPAGSDTGFIEKGTMMAEVDRVAFSLKVGEVSSVIASGAGFHIIQVIDKRGAGFKPLKAVREEIKDEIFRGKTNQKMQEWIAELRKKSYIDIKMK